MELLSGDSGFLSRDGLKTEYPTYVILPHLPTAQNLVSSSDGTDMPMPECEEALTHLWDYLDGNCDSQLAERIDAHVSSCVPCLGVRRSQERFFTSLAELRTRSSAPSRVRDRVRKALAAERGGSRLR